MSLIFISHSSADNTAAGELRDRLFQQGHSAEGSLFLDFDNASGIKAGQNWEQTLYRNIRACRAVIVLCSTSSMNSRWCFMEITHARALGKQLFPVKIDDCKVDDILTDHQVVDLTKDREEGFQRLLNGIAEAGLDPASIFTWDGRRPPYPGLLAFQEEDAPVFFGREEEIAEGLDLLNRVRRLGETRLLMVLGASGSGKSSVVRAGLVPRLRRDVERWLVVDPFRPQNDPTLALAEVMSRAFQLLSRPVPARDIASKIRPSRLTETKSEILQDPPPAVSHDELLKGLQSLEASLPGSPEMDSVRLHLRLARQSLASRDGAEQKSSAVNPVVDLINDLLSANRRDQAKALLIIDQFEELLDRPADHPANTFLLLLRALVDQADSPLLIVGTMRSDFLGAFQNCPALAGVRYESLSLGPMRNVTPVILEPAATAGVELEPALVETLVEDAKTGDALPLLAFTLRELYDRVGERAKLVTLKDYEDLGRLDGAVARSAGQLVATLNENQLVLLRQAFLMLARISDKGDYVRRVVTWREINPAVQPVLLRFVEARLLVSGDKSGDPTLEVAHEALFRSWDLLRGWLNESAEALRLRTDIEDVAPEWDKAGRPAEYLWRGGRLARARELRKLGNLALDTLGIEFIGASEEAEIRERQREEARRKRQLRLAMAFAAAVCVLLAGALYEYWQSNRQRNIAVARQLASDSGVVLSSDPHRTVAALLAIESLKLAPTVQGFEALWSAINGVGREITRVNHQSVVQAIAFSPDGRLVASGSRDNTSVVIEARTGRELARVKFRSEVDVVAISPDSTLVACNGDAEVVRVFEARSGKTVSELRHAAGSRVNSLAFSPDGKLIATGSTKDQKTYDGNAQVFEARTGHEVAQLVPDPVTGETMRLYALSPREGVRDQAGILVIPPSQVYSVAFSPDGTLVATGGVHKAGHVFETKTWKEVAKLITDDYGIAQVTFSTDSALVATAARDKTARVFESRTGREVAKFPHASYVDRVVFSPGSNFLATVEYGGAAHLFEVRTQNERVEHRRSNVADVAFSPDGELIATASTDEIARVYDLLTAREITRLEHSARVNALVFSPDSTLVATASGSTGGVPATAHVFESRTGSVVSRLPEMDPLALSPDGSLAAMGSRAEGAEVFEVKTGNIISRLPKGFLPIVFSPDGSLVAGGANDPVTDVRLVNARTGLELASINHQRSPANPNQSPDTGSGHLPRLQSLVFSPDRRFVASVSDTGAPSSSQPAVFEAATGKEVTSFQWRETGLFNQNVNFSPDSSLLAVGGHIFEVGSWRESRVLPVDGQAGIVFSPDSKLMAGKDRKGSVVVFDARSGREIARSGQEGIPKVFSRDGSLLAVTERIGFAGITSGWENKNTISILDVRSGREISHVADQYVNDVIFSADGKLVATRSNTRTNGFAQVFEARTGRVGARLTFDELVQWAQFSPDQRYLKVATWGKRLRVTQHLITASELMTDACSRLGRNLTPAERLNFLGSSSYPDTCSLSPALRRR